jgi:DNA (cytosine-5)-methyltransferase 1
MNTAIDLFAGIGGNTQGAERAGVKVLWAANHNPMAVQYHAANHPHTVHACQDLHQADWYQLPDHWLGMASPCCQGHAYARGKNLPQHDASRSTAWAPVEYLECCRPPIFLLENVPEFLKWILYPNWRGAVEALGYMLNPLILDAADHGVPQNRERLLIIGNLGRHPLPISIEKKPHVPVKNILDLNGGQWSKINKRGRARKTIDRVRRGREQFGDVFVMPYYSNGSGLTGRSINRPIGTVTTIDRWAIVRGDEMRMLSIDEYRAAMSFDPATKLPTSKRPALHMLGNATCPAQITDVINAIKAAA